MAVTPDGFAGLFPDGVSEDTLLGGRVRLLQPRTGYRAAIDPVTLAAAVPAQAGERVLDVGAGSGAVSLCLATRIERVSVVGLERQEPMVRLANANAWLNELGARVRFVHGDLLDPPPPVAEGGFDHVVMNPPFLEQGRVTVSADASRMAANVEGRAKLADWIAFAFRMVRHGGHVLVIHRADRLADLIAAVHARQTGGIVVFPLWPRTGAGEARRVILRCKAGSGAPFRLAPGLALHKEGGGLTEEADAVLRGGQPIRI